MRGISLFLSILALLAAVVSVTLFLLIGNEKEALRNEVADFRRQIESAEFANDQLAAESDALHADQNNLRSRFDELRARNVSLEARNNQLSRDVTQTREQLAAREQMEEASARELADLRLQLVDARALATATAGGASAERVAAYEARIADLERELADSRSHSGERALAAALARVPRNLTGSVLEIGPKSAFVVLNIGAEQGAVQSLEMTLRRDSEVIATVRLTDVQDSYSIAHILPVPKPSRIRKGDVASRS